MRASHLLNRFNPGFVARAPYVSSFFPSQRFLIQKNNARKFNTDAASSIVSCIDALGSFNEMKYCHLYQVPMAYELEKSLWVRYQAKYAVTKIKGLSHEELIKKLISDIENEESKVPPKSNFISGFQQFFTSPPQSHFKINKQGCLLPTHYTPSSALWFSQSTNYEVEQALYWLTFYLREYFGYKDEPPTGATKLQAKYKMGASAREAIIAGGELPDQTASPDFHEQIVRERGHELFNDLFSLVCLDSDLRRSLVPDNISQDDAHPLVKPTK